MDGAHQAFARGFFGLDRFERREEGHGVVICRIIDADDGHDGRVGSVMEYAGAEGGSGEVAEERDEDIGGVLVGDDPDNFVGA